MIYRNWGETFELGDQKYTVNFHVGNHPKHGKGFSIFIYKGEIVDIKKAFIAFAYNHVVVSRYYLRINDITIGKIDSAREGKRQILLYLFNYEN